MSATDAIWQQVWLPFLSDINVYNPLLTGFDGKVQALRVLAVRLCNGCMSRRGQQIGHAQMRDKILGIAKTSTKLGADDPRLTQHGTLDPHLSSLYRGMRNQDMAPNRVGPLPLQIIRHTQQRINPRNPFQAATIDLIWIAVFYLLRPGKYCHSCDSKPLTVANISFTVGTTKLDLHRTPLTEP